jgi:putative transposase
MADELRMALAEVLRKAELERDVDVLREGVRVLSHALMDLEVEQHVGAARHERTATRTGQRTGSRERDGDTRVGTVELRVPRVRDGSSFPSLLEPRKRAEQALAAVVQEAYGQGVSTRRVDELVRALGLEGVSKSQVARVCQALDAEVERFRTRRLEGPYPYLWLDATCVKARHDGRVCSMAVVIAIGVTASGEREVLGLDLGPSEDGACWTQFLRGLVARGLTGAQLVVSDAHEGLKGAIAAVLQGASWQRCRVHCLRNALALVPKAGQQLVPKAGQQLVATTIRPPASRAPVRPAGAGAGTGPVAARRRRLPSAVPPPGRAARRGGGGRARLPRLPPRALAPDLEQHPARAPQPRGQAAHRRGRHLPQRSRRHPPGRVCAR